MNRLVSLLGIFVIIGIAYLMSNNRKKISLRVMVWGMLLPFFFAFIVLPNSPLNTLLKSTFHLSMAPGEVFFSAINSAVIKLLSFTADGSKFIFGNLISNNVPIGRGAAGSNMPVKQVAGYVASTGAYFAFSVLPTIIFFSAFMSVLYYLGIMQRVVAFVAWIMERCMRTSGAETLSASASIFLGQTEAPLVVRPFVEGMTMSELACIMISGFAHASGGVIVAYVGMLKDYFPDIAGHLLTASIMSAPIAILITKIMYPEIGEPKTTGGTRPCLPQTNANVIDAAASGAGIGLQLALNVAAMLLAFIALISMLNFGIEKCGSLINWLCGTSLRINLQLMFGYLFAPFCWIMGVPWADCMNIGMLLGEKLAINEFVAYLHFADLAAKGVHFHYRSYVIAAYALCGFANFSSIAIQIGGIGAFAPSRRHDLAKLGLKAMFGGLLASCLTGTIAGLFV